MGLWPRILVFTFCCACSTALPLPGHFVARSKVSLTGVEFSLEALRVRWGAERAVRFVPDQGTMPRMGSISRYILRTTLGSFLLVLFGLTAELWVMQSLRSIDILTCSGLSVIVCI